MKHKVKSHITSSILVSATLQKLSHYKSSEDVTMLGYCTHGFYAQGSK